jgi:hypothetical protein
MCWGRVREVLLLYYGKGGSDGSSGHSANQRMFWSHITCIFIRTGCYYKTCDILLSFAMFRLSNALRVTIALDSQRSYCYCCDRLLPTFALRYSHWLIQYADTLSFVFIDVYQMLSDDCFCNWRTSAFTWIELYECNFCYHK